MYIHCLVSIASLDSWPKVSVIKLFVAKVDSWKSWQLSKDSTSPLLFGFVWGIRSILFVASYYFSQSWSHSLSKLYRSKFKESQVWTCEKIRAMMDPPRQLISWLRLILTPLLTAPSHPMRWCATSLFWCTIRTHRIHVWYICLHLP